jgi:hypothetical protein
VRDFLEEMWDIISGLFRRGADIEDRIVGGIMSLVVLLAAAMVFGVALVIFDHMGVSYAGVATVVVEDKYVESSSVITTMVPVGNTMTTSTIVTPETYHVRFLIEGTWVNAPVRKQFFDDVRIGDKLAVEYGLGRVSGNYVPITLTPLSR